MSATTTRFLPVSGRPLVAVALLLLIAAAVIAVSVGLLQQRQMPLPARTSIDTAANIRLEVADATYPAAGLGRLWVTIAGAGVAQLDPATGKQLRLTQIEASACGYLEVAFDLAWTSTCQTGGVAGVGLDGAVTQIDVEAAISDEFSTIGVDTNALWLVAGGQGEQLLKIDPVSRQVVARFTLAAGAASPEIGFGSVWVVNRNTGDALRLDPASGAVQATIKVGKLPRFLAVGAGAVWVLNQEDGTVSRIDPTSNAVTATIDVGSLTPASDIKVAGGSVWVRNASDIVRIDPAQGRAVALYGPVGAEGALAIDGESVWATSPAAGLVWRLANN